MAACLVPAFGQVKFEKQADRIVVEIDRQPFTTFYWGGDAPKPYLHPLRSASGKIITRGFPMEQIPGESRDHPHHRGLWFTHGEVSGANFWMNEKGYKPEESGHIIPKGEPSSKGNSIHARFEWQHPDGKPLLTEDRIMTFSGQGNLRMIDFDVTFTAIDTVKWGDTKEGFFAIRLADKLTEKSGTGRMVNAEGASGMKNVWGKPSAWVDYSGDLDGEKVGVAIFDHPGNFRHPTYWHARDYGLFAANPFGEHDFFNDKTRDGSLTLKPQQALRLRYRVVIHSGTFAAADFYREYAGKR